MNAYDLESLLILFTFLVAIPVAIIAVMECIGREKRLKRLEYSLEVYEAINKKVYVFEISWSQVYGKPPDTETLKQDIDRAIENTCRDISEHSCVKITEISVKHDNVFGYEDLPMAVFLLAEPV